MDEPRDSARSTSSCTTPADRSGFELCRLLGDRIRSLTILNTAYELSSVPYPGELFARVAAACPGR